MRLVLLALIFLLALTLGNAWWMRHGATAQSSVQASTAAGSHAPVYTPSFASPTDAASHRWSAFAWREAGAFVLTILLFGGYASRRAERR